MDLVKPQIHTAFEPVTGTWQYIVADPNTKEAAIIDPVLDYDPVKATISTSSADSLLQLAAANNFTIRRVMETHAHADHLTAARYIQQSLLKNGKPKADICIGRRITEVQATLGKKYGIDPVELKGSFDKLFDDNEAFKIGELKGEVLHLPGHTPDHVGYRIGENIFTGDSIFNPDVGSARCDFPGGSATDLFKSTKLLLSLPQQYRLYTGHDYPPAEREAGEDGQKHRPYTTVLEQLKGNKHVKDGTREEEFMQWRKERDASLGEPRLLHQSLQFNIRGGRLPKPSGEEGMMFVKMPLKGAGDVLDVMRGE